MKIILDGLKIKVDISMQLTRDNKSAMSTVQVLVITNIDEKNKIGAIDIN